MKCQFCSKPKIYEVIEIENNKAKTIIPLCQNCFVDYIAQSNLKAPPTNSSKTKISPNIKMQSNQSKINLGFTPEDANAFVQQMMKFVESITGQQNNLAPLKSPCPKCNTTLYDIAKTGKLGCPYCYDWYAEELHPTLQSAHHTPYSSENLTHIGKKPKNFKPLSPDVQKQQDTKDIQLNKLKYKLRQSVEKEDYETAAKLRDIITDIENPKD